MPNYRKIAKGGVIMTQNERSYLEEKLFLQTNLEPKLREIIEKAYEQYDNSCKMFPNLHEPKFGKLYCQMILENKSNELPKFKEIIAYTKETQTTYYMLRKEVLTYLNTIVNAPTE